MGKMCTFSPLIAHMAWTRQRYFFTVYLSEASEISGFHGGEYEDDYLLGQ
jgi:hypothetical protein